MNLMATIDALLGEGATKQIATIIAKATVPTAKKCIRLEKVLADLSEVVEALPTKLRDIDNRLSELERKL